MRKLKKSFKEFMGEAVDEIVKPTKKLLTKSSKSGTPTTKGEEGKVDISQKGESSVERQLYTNQLLHYKANAMLPSMLRFADVFSQDLKAKSNKTSKEDKNRAKHVFMTSYGFEVELFAGVIAGCDKALVVNDSSSGKYELAEKYNGHEHLTIVYPAKHHQGFGFGAFHPKLWLVEFEDRTLRVVVSSGNLCIGDWSVWSNGVWFKDFKIKKPEKIQPKEDKPEHKENSVFEPKKGIEDFGEYLINFIYKMFPKGVENLHKLGGIKLFDYDFKVPVDAVLVASIPGRHLVLSKNATSVNVYGLERLKQIMRAYPPSTKVSPKDMRIVFQASSIGWLTSTFLVRFLDSFVPDQKCLLTKENIADIFNVVFPSKKYVKESPFRDYSGCLFLNGKTYEKPSFIKEAMAMFEGSSKSENYKGIIPHIKICIVTHNPDFTIDDDTVIYFGSHNFTPSAWGKYEKEDSILQMNNTELGVVFPCKPGSAALKQQIVGDLPFKFPPDKYPKDQKPFYY